ncbi:MAG: type II toxin-antitoxin system prevent-host-death family antitoxin [Rhodospirillales bacterium]|nr:type II toxin-antitoxin system prevent-host-death family antitoxin [Rhodospirillales bacterium]
MPRIVTVGEAKTKLSDLIARAEEGEDVIVTRGGVPVARIVPLERPIRETVALIRQERERRPRVSAADIRTAKEEGRS